MSLKLSVLLVFFVIASYVSKADGEFVQKINRYSCCADTSYDDHMIKMVAEKNQRFSKSNPKGYLGSIGIVGDIKRNSAAYLAGISGFKVGADNITIFTSNDAAPIISSYSPDISVNTLLDSTSALLPELSKMDAVLLGPGLPFSTSKRTQVNRIVQEMKSQKKPLVLSLNEYFLTPAFYNTISNYPKPGVILMMNNGQFEKFYPLLNKDPFDVGNISIDYTKLGNNVYIMRKGFSDSGISSDVATSWMHSKGGSPRRSPGQGSALAGMTTVFFNWALKNIYFKISATNDSMPMLPAAVATYSASMLMRTTNQMVFEEKEGSALTTDMIKKIGIVLKTKPIPLAAKCV